MTVEWGTPGFASTLVGAQMGSEGKGSVSAYLAHQIDNDAKVRIAATAAGGNSGHTTRYRDGRKFVAFHLPTTAIVRPEYTAYADAGAIVDIPALAKEIDNVGIDRSHVVVHPRAAVVTDDHRAEERLTGSSVSKIASTQKGIGAALSAKVMRKSPLVQGVERPDWLRVEDIDLNRALVKGASVVIETPQGVDLSINSQFAPFTTSRECHLMAALSDARVHPSFSGPVCTVFRTKPIRVGELRNEAGELIGSSGEFWPDSKELDWERDFPGVRPEVTTVTGRIRRIASWSSLQYEHSLCLCRPSIVALTFCDYLPSGIAFLSHLRRMRTVEDKHGLYPNYVFGFGPFVEDLTEDQDRAVAWFDRRSF